MSAYLNIAVRAARQAGDFLARAGERLHEIRVETKGPNDYVSEVDREAERRIIEVLHRAYPDHAILAEESGARGEHAFEWVVDPLDGTTNFLHGFPFYCVSIALRVRGRLECGVVYDPVHNDLFTAQRGAGARLNDHRLRVSARTDLAGGLIGTGFPFRAHVHLDGYLAAFRAVFEHTGGVRRAGSAALDLAYVAAGRFDGFWEVGLSPWDMAAGALLIQEAGGLVTDLSGGADFLATGNIIAGNPRVARALRAAVQPHLAATAPA
jgi:myo-inositol-1(or 4)-monophosphatase